MKDFRRCVLALLALMGAAAAQAQPPAGRAVQTEEPGDEPRSHVDIKLRKDSLTGFRQELARGEDRARLLAMLQVVAKNPSLAQLAELQRELQKFRAAGGDGIRPDDPSNMIQRLLEALQRRPGGPLPTDAENVGLPMNLKSLQNQFNELPPGEKAQLQQRLQQTLEQASQSESPFAEPQSAESSSTDLPDPEQWFEQWLIKQVKRIDTNSEFFHSPAVQDMFKEIHRLTRTEQWERLPRSTALGGVGKSLVEWGQRLRLDKAVSQLRLPPLQNLSVGASESRWRVPRLRLPSWAMSPPGAGGGAAPSTDAGTGVVRTLILTAVVGVLVWLVLTRYRRRQKNSDATRVVPLSWPVPPDAVGTREDLIRAFEYLSLTQLGPEARSQHHRALAEELGGAEPPRQRAAGQLADLYEQARYAPEHGPLSADDLQAARQSLAFLAGKALA